MSIDPDGSSAEQTGAMSPRRPRPRCRLCGAPAIVLLYEPDYWVCRPCSNRLGRDWLEQERNTPEA